MSSSCLHARSWGFCVALSLVLLAALGCPTSTPPSGSTSNGGEDSSASNYEGGEANGNGSTETPPNSGGNGASNGTDSLASAANPRTAVPRPPTPSEEEEGLDAFPFGVRISLEENGFEFPDDPDRWINTAKPLTLEDLKGKYVILDFWTYCCINCIHILPELKKLERAYPNNLVVIGVHCAKFETEKDVNNVAEAVLRYEIEHPVLNDAEHGIWRMMGIEAWPSIRMIDPEGNLVYGRSSEFTFEDIDEIFQVTMPYYREKGALDERPLKFDLLRDKQNPSPLRFPGKVLADEPSSRLFIADSNNNRVVISTLDGKLIETIGTGAIGQDDGGYEEATFNKPQGMVLKDQTLYVADTENHLIRKIDLEAKTVKTIAGTGVQGRNAWPGLDFSRPFATPPDRYVAKPLEFAINSPWALYIHEDDLFIAMAGPHQIWRMKLDESEIGPYAGNGREDIVDGPLLPATPYERDYSSFAQPSGLTSDGKYLYVADSEGSSIRAVPFGVGEEVKTIIGTSKLPYNRLFAFGNRDGKGLLEFNDEPLEFHVPFIERTTGPALQHCLGVVYHDGTIYAADTYNNAIKEIDVASASVKTIAGEFPAAAKEEKGLPDAEDAADDTEELGESAPETADTDVAEASTVDPRKAAPIPPMPLVEEFDEPAGITYANGKLYIADTNNHRIRTIDLKSGNKISTLEIVGLKPPKVPPEPVAKAQKNSEQAPLQQSNGKKSPTATE